MTARAPSIVVSVFDQKERTSPGFAYAKVREMAGVDYSASGVLRYCTRIGMLPSEARPPVDIETYVTRGGDVGAVAFRNFVTPTLAGRARELELDALRGPKGARPWIHGAISLNIHPDEMGSGAERLLELGHSLMRKFGVSENRYMLAVHTDSDHIHVHFFYSRIGPDGCIRERDRRWPKFLAEEAAAALAHEFGFELEDRHLTRMTPEGLLDLASGKIVRRPDFTECPEGMKARNRARQRTKDNETLKLALVARYMASNLEEFRERLASHGITYEKNGSGARIIDRDGNHLDASVVDRRLSPAKLLEEPLKWFPPTPADLEYRALEVRSEHAWTHSEPMVPYQAPVSDDSGPKGDAVVDAHLAQEGTGTARLAQDAAKTAKLARRPKSSPQHIEENRFFDGAAIEKSPPNVNQKAWADCVSWSLRARPGRPPHPPKLPGWQPTVRFDGALGGRSSRRTVHFAGAEYETREQAWQTEIWRGAELVASVRYSRMAIVSKDEKDLRAALLAAQKAWGSVEIYGRPAFKKRMAKLAIELGVPITNRELHAPMAKALAAQHVKSRLSRKEMSGPLLQTPVAASGTVPPAFPLGHTERPVHASDREAPANLENGTAHSLSRVEGAARQSTQPKAGAPDRGRQERTERIVDFLDRVDRERWPISGPPQRKQFALALADAPKLGDKDLELPYVQERLQRLRERNERDLSVLKEAARAGQFALTLIFDRAPPRPVLHTRDSELAELWRPYSRHGGYCHSLADMVQKGEAERGRAEIAKLTDPPESLPSRAIGTPAVDHVPSSKVADGVPSDKVPIGAQADDQKGEPRPLGRVGSELPAPDRPNGAAEHPWKMSEAEGREFLRPRVLGKTDELPKTSPPGLSKGREERPLSEGANGPEGEKQSVMTSAERAALLAASKRGLGG